MECKIYHTVGTIPKSNIKIVGKHKLDTHTDLKIDLTTATKPTKSIKQI
jgi:hypothetical protein